MRHAACLLLVLLTAAAAYAVTPAQCIYFESEGKVTLCHATGSAKNPYVILRVATEGCLISHSTHDRDYVAVGDPTCGGGGCLPDGAPCDDTLPCCEGLACEGGNCVREEHENKGDETTEAVAVGRSSHRAALRRWCNRGGV